MKDLWKQYQGKQHEKITKILFWHLSSAKNVSFKEEAPKMFYNNIIL